MSLRDNLGHDVAAALQSSEPAELGSGATILEAVSLLKDRGAGCVVITEEHRPIGILTERDILTKVVSANLPLSTEISTVMTRSVEVIEADCPIATVIRTMHGGGFRHMPVVDGSGRLTGVVSVKRIVEYLAEHFPSAVFNLPPEPAQQQLAREGA